MQNVESLLELDLAKWLSEDNHLLQQTLDILPVPVFYKNADGVYLGCNKAFEDFIQIPKNELVGKTVYELFDKDLADVYQRTDQELFDNPGDQIYEKLIRSTQDDPLYVRFHKRSFYDRTGKVAGLLGLIFDITEQKELEQRLTHHALYDDLTGLLNRREGIRLGEKLYQDAEKGQIDLGVIMVDIDHFKQINDTYGHLAGDEVLRNIAKVLDNRKQSSDVILRWGGEEFLIIVSRLVGTYDQSFEEYIKATANHYRHSTKKAVFDIQGVNKVISFSCGLSIYKQGTSWTGLLHDADEALYEAKNSGRNCSCISGSGTSSPRCW